MLRSLSANRVVCCSTPIRAEPKVSGHPNRRSALSLLSGVLLGAGLPINSAEALPRGSVDTRFAEAFNKALASGGNPAIAERAWTAAIELSPTNSSAWSNRATTRLQNGRWQEAADDFEKAIELERAGGGSSIALLQNNLGNAQGALGQWGPAKANYVAASNDPEMGSIATANLALANFQTGNDAEAIQIARKLIRADPEFLDMRAALTAFLWSTGDASDAEEEWTRLACAQNGLGGTLYSRNTALERVRNRWPPRATAALDAFISLSASGIATDYDSKIAMFTFF